LKDNRSNFLRNIMMDLRGYIEKEHYQLTVHAASGTGQTTAYGLKKSFGQRVEITREEWQQLAEQMVLSARR
jgi:hypothetical protein